MYFLSQKGEKWSNPDWHESKMINCLPLRPSVFTTSLHCLPSPSPLTTWPHCLPPIPSLLLINKLTVHYLFSVFQIFDASDIQNVGFFAGNNSTLQLSMNEMLVFFFSLTQACTEKNNTPCAAGTGQRITVIYLWQMQ